MVRVAIIGEGDFAVDGSPYMYLPQTSFSGHGRDLAVGDSESVHDVAAISPSTCAAASDHILYTGIGALFCKGTRYPDPTNYLRARIPSSIYGYSAGMNH